MSTRIRNTQLRALRESLSLSQRAFALRAHIHPVYLCHLETGAARMGGVTALKIADAYRDELEAAGVTIEDLMRGGGDEVAA